LRDAPSGFVEWATKNGAVQLQSDEQWESWRKANKQ